ncbi:MAG: hypothetical protein KatS3mg102_0476 [Planctomycetota bacterium]|nr:MAG: hypothetical protein KatS3mg102_0476 [Planctomycetota bacterium]
MARHRQLRELARALIAGGLLATLLLGPALVPGQALRSKDAAHLYPVLLRRNAAAWARGELPLWNPEVACGVPHLADPMTQALYPPSALCGLAGPFAGLKLFVWAHLAALVPAFALAAHSFGAGGWPALAAGVLLAACGPVLSQHWNLMWMAGLPWWLVALAALRALLHRRGGPGAALGLGAAAAAMVLGGALELLLAFAVYAAIEALLVLWGRPLAAGVACLSGTLPPEGRAAAAPPGLGMRLRSVGLAVLAAALALGLTAVQWLPTLELTRLSSRAAGTGPYSAYLWSLPPGRLLELVAPQLFGPPGTEHNWAVALRPHPLKVPFLGGIFVGAPWLVLAVAGLAGGRRAGLVPLRLRVALGGMAAVLAVLALGDACPLLPWLRATLPGVAYFRYPEKFVVMAMLPLALLAALGLRALQAGERRAARAATASALVLLVLLGAGAAAAASTPEPLERWLAQQLAAAGLAMQPHPLLRSAAGSLGWGAAAALLAALAAGAAARGAGGERAAWRRAAAPALAALALGVLLVANRGLVRTIPAVRLLERPGPLPPPEAFASPAGTMRLATDLRVYHERLTPYHAELLGYRSAQGYGSVTLAAHERLRRAVAADEPRLHRLASVRWVLAVEEAEPDTGPLLVVREVAAPLARAQLVGRASWAPDATAAAWRLASPEFDPHREVVLLGTPGPGVPPPCDRRGAALGRVRMVRETDTELHLELEATAPAWLVITDAYYPGWQAELDGRPAELLCANLAFRALMVPQGRHRVRLSFAPRSVRQGLAISLATLGLVALAAAGGWLARRRRRRRERAPR